MYYLYGIPNCNTVKKAMDFLKQNNIEYEFINFKKAPPTRAQIEQWKNFLNDWPVNKKGPTYRKIKENFESASDAEKFKLLKDNSSALKRPILTKGSKTLLLGFDEKQYRSELQ